MAPSEAALNRVLYVLLIIVGYLFVGEIQRATSGGRPLGRSVYRCGPVVAGGVEARVAARGFESRLHSQRRVADALIEADGDVQHLVSAVAGHEEEYHTLECVSRLGKRVHVGPDEFRDMADGATCSGLDVKDAPAVGPHELFEVVPLDDDAVDCGRCRTANLLV